METEIITTNKREIVDIKRCNRCIMPETYPGITLDTEGVCNICRHFDNKWGPFVSSAEERQRSEAKLRKIFEAAKQKHKPYDALIGISGGKDSSYCLYLCTQVYGLNVLAFTKASCFLSDDAPTRIDKLVKTFNVPHLYYQDPMSPKLAGIFMRKTGNFCTACELSAFNTAAIIAREYDIPIIVMGNSSRTEAPPPKFLNPWDTSYFYNVMKGEGYRERIRNSLYRHNYLISEGLARILGQRRIVVLPDYVDWDEEKISDLFRNEFNFSFGEEHSDCWAHEVANYLYEKKCGGIHPTIAKYSMLVRNGKMSRDEAMAAINNSEENTSISGLDRLLKVIGMTRDEFEIASERSPQPYIKGFSRLFNILRRKVRRQAL
jgi:hypothetical protein